MRMREKVPGLSKLPMSVWSAAILPFWSGESETGDVEDDAAHEIEASLLRRNRTEWFGEGHEGDGYSISKMIAPLPNGTDSSENPSPEALSTGARPMEPKAAVWRADSVKSLNV